MKQFLWIGIYAFINLLFVAKYGAPAVGGSPWLGLTAAIAAFGAVVAAYRSRRLAARLVCRRGTALTLTLAGALLLIVAAHLFDASHLAVARNAARDAWIGRLLAGEFPYGTDARPSGMPVLFLVALPFHLLGNPGLLQVAAFLALCAGVLFAPRETDKTDVDLRPFLLLLLSPLLLYEVVVRSDLFANMVLLILYARWLNRMLGRPASPGHRHERLRLFGAGALGGLVLATRLIVLLPLPLSAGRLRRRGPGTTALLAAGLASGFLAAILPFLAWDPARFLSEGPLAIQGAYITPEYVVPIVLVSLFEGIRVRTPGEMWESAALLLFVAILLPFLHTVALTGLDGALFGDRFDISWFAFPLPFLVLALGEASPLRRPESRSAVSRPDDPNLVDGDPGDSRRSSTRGCAARPLT